VRWKVDISRNA